MKRGKIIKVTLCCISYYLLVFFAYSNDFDILFDDVPEVVSTSTNSMVPYAESIYLRRNGEFYLDVRLDEHRNIVYCDYAVGASEFDMMFGPVVTATNYVLKLHLLDDLPVHIEIVASNVHELLQVNYLDVFKFNKKKTDRTLIQLWRDIGVLNTNFCTVDDFFEQELFEGKPSFDEKVKQEDLRMLYVLDSKYAGKKPHLLVPTPLPEKPKVAYFEYRDHQIFEIPLKRINEGAEQKLKNLTQQADGDNVKLLGLLGEARLVVDVYEVDLNYTLMGLLSFTHVVGTQGCSIDPSQEITDEHCIVEQLQALQSITDHLGFIVRGHAPSDLDRVVEWVKQMGFKVSVEESPLHKPIQFGLGGQTPAPQ